MADNQKTVEFRGCDNLVIAEVTADSKDAAYTTSTVQTLAPVAEIAKTVENSSETHYYDNTGMIIIRSEGSDEITLTVPALPIKTLATVTGQTVDPVTGALIDGESVEKYYALGYRLKLTDGTYRYVWRLKGSFNIPDETSSTEDDSTDTNNQQLVYTGVKTVTKFSDGKRAKGIVIDERDGLADVSDFFARVQTPDTLPDLSIVSAVSVSPTTASVAVGQAETLTATVTPSDFPNVFFTSDNEAVATVSDAGVVTGVSAGTATITVTAGAKTATCEVTVTA